MNDFDPRIDSSDPQATGRDSSERGGDEQGGSYGRSNEVTPKPARRRFTGAEKLRILAAADLCQKPGELGALLRREGIFSSHISTWRSQRKQGALSALSGKKRGRKPLDNPLAAKLAAAEKRNAKLTKQLEKAETIISFQKKFLEIFGEMPSQANDEAKS